MTESLLPPEAPPRAATGIPGLDDILGGGLPEDRVYLVKGAPGTGKTTLALQFLAQGARAGERVLYISLSETDEEIRQVAASHGWSLEGVDVFELSSADQTLRLVDESLFASEDVDLKETMRILLEEVARVKPKRVVFDSLSEIRLLAGNSMRYRRQLLALKQHFAGQDCTVVLLDDRTADGSDMQLESIAHGVLMLEQIPVQYGADRRRLRVVKLRGSTFRSGYHDCVVHTGGLTVFPRLIAAEHRTSREAEPISSGIPELDVITGGGIDRATCTLLMGPAGTGKSAIATQFAAASAARGEVATMFLFEERVGTWLTRGTNLGMNLQGHISAGKLHVHQIDPAELAPDEFAHLVRDAVEKGGSKVVVIDSINGYFTAMPEARFLLLQMHELLSFLAERGVASVMTMAQSGLTGPTMTSPVDVSYLADTILLLRYFELRGRVQKAVSVLKKRSGRHEDSIRGVELGSKGISVSEPLTELQGVLSGIPNIFPAMGEREKRGDN